ncbi:MAG: hypothetical protein ACJAYF_002690 [Arenicella sp.]|jgi:hypothetical protein
MGKNSDRKLVARPSNARSSLSLQNSFGRTGYSSGAETGDRGNNVCKLSPRARPECFDTEGIVSVIANLGLGARSCKV